VGRSAEPAAEHDRGGFGARGNPGRDRDLVGGGGRAERRRRLRVLRLGVRLEDDECTALRIGDHGEMADGRKAQHRDLGGIDRAGLNATDPAARRAAFMGVVVSHAALWFDDKSLVGRVIGVLAMQQNATPEQVRAEAAMPLAGLSMLLPDEPDAAAQVSAFLDHPHSLRISLDPPAPVSLGAVAAAPITERAHMLGLKITGN